MEEVKITELFGNLEVKKVDRTDIRDIVADRVKLLRKNYRRIPLHLSRFNLKLAETIKNQWIKENKEFLKTNKKEKPLERLKRWKAMVKKYRLVALNELSTRWYSKIWKLRSDTVLIASLYEFSEIDDISQVKENIIPKELTQLKPIILRIKGLKKPIKKKILMRDITYDIASAYLEMVKPLEAFCQLTSSYIDNLIAPRKKLTIKTKIKRYQDVLYAREYLTLILQAISPRQEATYNDLTLKNIKKKNQASK